MSISEIGQLELRKAQLVLIKEKPYLTPDDICLLFGISRSRLVVLDREGKGPPWLMVGGTKHCVDSSAHMWFKALGSGDDTHK